MVNVKMLLIFREMEPFNPPRENIFQKMETLKKFLIFFQKKAVLLFQETEVSYISGNPIKNFPRSKSKNKTSYISKDNLQSLKIKNFLYFSL